MTVSIQLIRIPEGEAVTHREYYASATPFVIGREYDCDLVLNDSGQHISRQHAELQRNEAGDLVFLDRSTNGTLLNGKELNKGDKVALSDGDRVMIGEYELLFGLSYTRDAATQPSNQRKAALPKRPFCSNSRINEFALINPAIEPEVAIAPEPDAFTEGGLDLESDLLFDPFAKGPELKEDAARSKTATPTADKIDDGDLMPFDSTALDMQSSTPPNFLVRQNHVEWEMSRDREANESAIEAAVDRLLALVDPVALESEYKMFLGPFSRTSRRYWKIHRQMFARKRANGEYIRLFKAMLAEEIKKR